MIRAIKFASIPVHNQDKSLAFYTQKLGFKVGTDQPFDNHQRWIELTIPRAESKVVLFTPAGHESRIGGFSNITFLSDDVESTHQLLQSRGVEFLQPPQKADWGTAAVFVDSDGNQFVLSSK